MLRLVGAGRFILFMCGQLGVNLVARFFFQWLTYFADKGGRVDGDADVATGAVFTAAAVSAVFLGFRVFDAVIEAGVPPSHSGRPCGSRSRCSASKREAAGWLTRAFAHALTRPRADHAEVTVSRIIAEDGHSVVAGDVAPEVAEVAGWVSPNPGGVGPMTRAMLLSNVVLAAERAAGVSAPVGG